MRQGLHKEGDKALYKEGDDDVSFDEYKRGEINNI